MICRELRYCDQTTPRCEIMEAEAVVFMAEVEEAFTAAVAAASEGDLRLLRAMQVHALRPRAPAPVVAYAARPSSNYSRSYANSLDGSQRSGNSSAARPATADGQWHSFGNASGGRGPETAQSGAGASSNAGGFHVFSGNRGNGSTGTVRSFSGQGDEIYENAPAARSVVPRYQSLSTLHDSVSGSLGASPGFRSNSALSASSRIAGGSTFLGNRGSADQAALEAGAKFGNSFGFGFGNRFRRGCWNCGFGFGFGGWGWPWLGFGFWHPLWYDPWWALDQRLDMVIRVSQQQCLWLSRSGILRSRRQLKSAGRAGQPIGSVNQGPTNGNWITPNGPSPSLAPNSANLAVPVLIYMKNGSVLTVRDYWMIDGELHYILMSGTQRTTDLEQVDLPRTNTENAKSGVRFIFKSEPSVPPSAEPDAQPGNPNAPAPTQQLNAVPQPEART